MLAGSLDGDVAEVDLLGFLGSPLPPGLTLTAGPVAQPAFHFRQGANVAAFARYLVPRTFLREFAITAHFRPAATGSGYLFAIMEYPRSPRVLLGLEVTRHDSRLQVALHHSDAHFQTRVVRFHVPGSSAAASGWVRLGLRVARRQLTLFVDCDQKDIRDLDEPLRTISLPPMSVLYVARPGWAPGFRAKSFEVRGVWMTHNANLGLWRCWWSCGSGIYSLQRLQCTVLLRPCTVHSVASLMYSAQCLLRYCTLHSVTSLMYSAQCYLVHIQCTVLLRSRTVHSVTSFLYSAHRYFFHSTQGEAGETWGKGLGMDFELGSQVSYQIVAVPFRVILLICVFLGTQTLPAVQL